MMRPCGLLGETLGHSYSPVLHGMLADYEYRLYEKKPEELESFLRTGDFQGLNVTIPYKKTVLPYCRSLSVTARAIGSVNTLVRQKDGSLAGYNTDAMGFEALLRRGEYTVRGEKAVVLGTGGAAVMARYVLQRMGASSVVLISRRGEDNYENLARHRDAALLVNATPVGMYPKNGASPVDLRLFPRCRGVVDLVYNPARTALLQQAEERGIPHSGGLYMLVAQAWSASALFLGKTGERETLERVAGAMAHKMENIVLVGMPGCGKSTAAAALGELLHRPVFDSDAEVEKKAGLPIPEIFRRYGEEQFRLWETEALEELGKRSGSVIATGGGCVLREENYPLLHQNGRIVWLQREPSRLARAGRPLSERGDLEELYRRRESRYRRFSDMVIDNNGPWAETLRRLREALT